MTAADIVRPERNPLARLYAALIDPARGERTMALLLAAYAAIWTVYGTIAKSSQDLHFDIGEMFAWSHEVVWSAPSHPPLGAWIMRAWFSVMPVADWSFYLLAMIVATVALWIAWRIAGRYLSPEKRVTGLLLMTFLPFYNFHALKYNASSILTPFWAIATSWFLLSFETRLPRWAALTGLAAAAAMLGKYWSICLLAGLALGALTDPRRAAYFRTAAPWITTVVGAAALAPHVIFIATHGFSTVSFAMTAHETSFAMAAGWSLYFLVSVIGYIAIPSVLAALVAWPPQRAAIRDSLWPADAERRIFWVIFWAPILVAAIVAVAVRSRLDPLWTMSGMTLLPILLLASPRLAVNRAAAIRLLALAIIFPLAALAASPIAAIVIHKNGVPNYQAQYSLVAKAVQQAWDARTGKPLRLVGSFRTVVDGSNPYFPTRPATYAITSPWRTPWADDARIARDGIAIFCPLQETPCVDAMNAYAARFGAKVETVTLARRYFGTDDAPVQYGIAIIPPKP